MKSITGQSRADSKYTLGRSLAGHVLVATGSVAADTVAEIVVCSAPVLVVGVVEDFASVLAEIEQRMQD